MSHKSRLFNVLQCPSCNLRFSLTRDGELYAVWANHLPLEVDQITRCPDCEVEAIRRQPDRHLTSAELQSRIATEMERTIDEFKEVVFSRQLTYAGEIEDDGFVTIYPPMNLPPKVTLDQVRRLDMPEEVPEMEALSELLPEPPAKALPCYFCNKTETTARTASNAPICPPCNSLLFGIFGD